MISAITSFLIATTLLGCAGQSEAAETDQEYGRIGFLLPPEEAQALSLREGALLAQEQVAASPGGNLQVIIRGRTGQWGADAIEAARLVTDDAVAAMIAPPDGAASHLVLQVSGRTAVPVLTLCADSSVTQTGVPWALRIVPSTKQEATILLQGTGGLMSSTNRWFAVVPPERAGREIAGDLVKAARACGTELLSVQDANGGSGLENIAERALRERAHGILIWLAPAQAGQLARKLRAEGFKGIMAGPGKLQCQEFFAAAAGAAEGFVVAAIAVKPADVARRNDFQNSYARRWGHAPDTMAALSYDAIRLMARLLDNDGFRVAPHRLPANFGWPGASGEIRFDAQGDRVVALELRQAKSGQFLTLGK